MWGIRNGHKVYVGHVTMVFWERRSDAYFEGTGKTASYFKYVYITGILPGNGGSKQSWTWKFKAHNWVFGGPGVAP